MAIRYILRLQDEIYKTYNTMVLGEVMILFVNACWQKRVEWINNKKMNLCELKIGVLLDGKKGMAVDVGSKEMKKGWEFREK